MSGGPRVNPELTPPPARDFYNISVKDQMYGTAPTVATSNQKTTRTKRRKCKCKNPCYVGNCNPCRCCWTWLCILLVLIVVGGGAFYAVVRPKSPDYTVTDFRLTGLDSSLATKQLSTESSIAIRSHNGNNKITFVYKSIDVQVETQTSAKTGDVISLAAGSIAPFTHKKGATVEVGGNLKATPMAMSTQTHAALLKARTAGSLPLKVTVDLKARAELAGSDFVKLKIKVRCNIDINPKITTGSQILSKDCHFKAHPYV